MNFKRNFICKTDNFMTGHCFSKKKNICVKFVSSVITTYEISSIPSIFIVKFKSYSVYNLNNCLSCEDHLPL